MGPCHSFRGNIAERRRAHPVRGKDRSPPCFRQFRLRTDFLPGKDADLGRTKGSSSCRSELFPQNPNLEHLKYQAKDLLKDHAARSTAAAQRIREFHPRWGRRRMPRSSRPIDV